MRSSRVSRFRSALLISAFPWLPSSDSSQTNPLMAFLFTLTQEPHISVEMTSRQRSPQTNLPIFQLKASKT